MGGKNSSQSQNSQEQFLRDKLSPRLQDTRERVMNDYRTEPLLRISRRIAEDNVTVYSAMASFFISISLIPLVMILVSGVRFFIPDSLGTIWKNVLLVLPPEIRSFAMRTMNELLHANTTSVVSLSVLGSLWAASKGIMGLEQGMHTINHVPARGSYLIRRLRCTLYTLVFICAIFAVTIFLLFGSTLLHLAEEHVSFLTRIAVVVLGFRILITTILLILVFALGYRYLGGIRCTFQQVLPGALFSTLGWMVFSGLFSLYITNFSSYTYLYGSMGALILMLLWLYFCMVILLLGAEVNIILRERNLTSNTNRQ